MDKSSLDNIVDIKSTLSAKQRRIAELKIKGLKNTEIGAKVYPNAKPKSQRQLVSRELKKEAVAQYYEQSKLIALKENDITWTRVMKAVSDGLGDSSIKVRLQAARQASEYLDIPNKSVEDNQELVQNLANVSNEIELQRLLFKRKEQ